MKKIILLTPCYNEERRLDAFLDSIKKQTIKVDIIAIDDGSTDKTFSKLRASGLLYTARNDRNIGITKTLNKLFEIARSYSPEYLTWSAVDEELYPDGIERRLNHIQASDCDIVVTGADAQTSKRKIRYPDVLPQFKRLQKANFNKLHEELLPGNFFQSPILLDMNKVKFEDLLLDEKTKHFCDWDQYLTLSSKYKFCFMDESTCCSGWDGRNFSRPNPALFPQKLKEFSYVLSKHLTATKHEHNRGAAFTLGIITKAILRLAMYYSDLALAATFNAVNGRNGSRSLGQ